MNDDLASKQAYLRENVLETGYDADEFMAFLQLRKGENGLDLNNWKMNELISVVEDFIKSKNNISSSQNQEKNNEFENEQNIQPDNHINDIINNDISNNINNAPKISLEEDDSYIGKCLANEITSFSNIENLKVKLSSPKKVEGKMFQKAFISYVVTTEPFDYITNKRYSDFVWLKKVLSLIYINCVIPPLCKKNFSDRFTEPLIEKRMRSIEKFMNGILEHPLMKNSEVIKDFLSVTNTREYNKIIEKYNKIKKAPSIVRQIKTINGETDIGINQEKEIYFDNIKNYVKGNYQLLQKITKGYKSMMNIMQQLSNKMKDISKLWKLVLDKSIKYSDSHNTSETFNIMSKLMEDWSEIQKSQLKVINVNIREYFRYVKNEFNGLKEMSDKVQAAKNNYIKFKEKLLKTKESLFEKQDHNTWQLKEEDKQNIANLLKNKEFAFSRMLPQDTSKLKEYKNFYGCMLNSLISEFERIRKVNAKRHKNNTTSFVRDLSSELTNLHVCLADRLSEFYELKDDKDIYYVNSNVLSKQVESVPEILDENNNNNEINNNVENNIDIHENNVNTNEINNIEIKNNNNENNNINEDIAKDFEKVDYKDCIDNNNLEIDKKNNKNKKSETKKEKEIKKKSSENNIKNNIKKIKEENNNIINNIIENKDIENNIIKKENLIENKEDKKDDINNKNSKKNDINNNIEKKEEKNEVIKEINKDDNKEIKKEEKKEMIKEDGKEDNKEENKDEKKKENKEDNKKENKDEMKKENKEDNKEENKDEKKKENKEEKKEEMKKEKEEEKNDKHINNKEINNIKKDENELKENTKVKQKDEDKKEIEVKEEIKKEENINNKDEINKNEENKK